jgi:hypothetical protein
MSSASGEWTASPLLPGRASPPATDQRQRIGLCTQRAEVTGRDLDPLAGEAEETTRKRQRGATTASPTPATCSAPTTPRRPTPRRAAPKNEPANGHAEV